MNRSLAREPQYKQRTRDQVSRGRDPRCEGRRESSEDSSTEEEETTDRNTEDSEDTGESQQERRSYDWEALGRMLDRQKKCERMAERPDNFVFNSCMPNARVIKHDKNTQKNLISPLPSFLSPPIYRQVSGLPNYKLSTIKSSMEPVNGPEKSPGCAQKNGHDEEDVKICIRHRHRHRRDKLCEKHKAQTGLRLRSGGGPIERVLTCLQRGADSVLKHSKTTTETEGCSKQSTEETTGNSEPSRRSNRSKEGGKYGTLGKCLDYTTVVPEFYNENVRRCLVRDLDSEKELRVHDSFLPKNSTEEENSRKPLSDGSGKLREKLVYVVEEEGNNVTKLETDLFSVNEILAIKKDLLELSEFAKKLKKLKEMKRQSDKGKKMEKGCHCKPVADLLSDVNRRIEALEARQEELERGSTKYERKEDAETDSKTSDKAKTGSDTPLKTPIMAKQSAMASVPGFPKAEMIVSRAEGFSNNSEIVNELMDIKSQLKRLEKRRLTKEASAEAATAGDPKPRKKKGHAIAVFSSRTYILTSENYEKNKNDGKEGYDGVGSVESKTEEKNRRSKADSGQAKENVANWLKTVALSAEDSGQDVGPEGKGDIFEDNCQKCSHKLKDEDCVYQGMFGGRAEKICRNCRESIALHTGVCLVKRNSLELNNIQEPQKNRVTEGEGGKDEITEFDVNRNDNAQVNSCSREFLPQLECKQCFMTPSGRLFTLKDKNNQWPMRSIPVEGPPAPPASPDRFLGGSPRIIRRSASSCSVSSATIEKKKAQRLKGQNLIDKRSEELKGSLSKSMQELSSTSTKDKKTILNMTTRTLRNSKSPPLRDKNQKESKNERVKQGKEPDVVDKENPSPLTTSSNSELLRTINLETDSKSTSESRRSDNAKKNKALQNYSMMALARAYYKYRHSKDRCKESEKRKNMKKEKEENKKRKNKEKEKKSKKEIKRVCKCKKENNLKKEKKLQKLYKKEAPSRDRREAFRCSHDEIPVQMMYTATECRRRHGKHRCKKDVKCHRSSGFIKKRCGQWGPSSGRWCYEDDCLKYEQACPEETVADDIHKGNNRQTETCESSGSDGSLDLYRNREKKMKELEKSREKKPEEPCAIKNIFRRFRFLYPRFSNFNLLPWGGYCEDSKKKEPSNKSGKTGGKQVKIDNTEPDYMDEEEDEEFDDPCCGGQSSRQHRSTRGYGCGHHEQLRAEHLKNCKCVRVYLQTQTAQEWPGVRPFKNSSEESFTEETTLGSSETCSSEVDDIYPFLTNREFQNYYVGHSREEKEEMEDEEKEDNEKNSNECVCDNKKHRKKREKCICDKCGNVHKKKKPKKKKEKKKKEKCNSTTTEEESEASSEARNKNDEGDGHKKHKHHSHNKHKNHGKHGKHSKRGKHCNSDTKNEYERHNEGDVSGEGDVQVKPSESGSQRRRRKFAFLTGYCPPKPKTPKTKSKSSIFSKVKESRAVKACRRKSKESNSKTDDCKETSNAGSTRNKSGKRKRRRSKRRSESDGMEDTTTEKTASSKCICAPKLNNIEERLSKLEKHKCGAFNPDDDERKEKKKKNKKKKKKDTSESCESEKSEEKNHKKKKKKKNDTSDSCESEKSEEKKHKKKNKKKEKNHNDDDCENEESGGKKQKKKKKRKKKKDSSESCNCEKFEGKNKSRKNGENSQETRNDVYYCTCLGMENGVEGRTTKTTTTNTTTEETKSTVSSKPEEAQKTRKKRLTEMLSSSIHSFWRNLRRARGGKGDAFTKSDTGILDDCSKSSPLPKTREVHSLKEEPSSLLKKRISKKKRKKKQKEKAPKSKRSRSKNVKP